MSKGKRPPPAMSPALGIALARAVLGVERITTHAQMVQAAKILGIELPPEARHPFIVAPPPAPDVEPVDDDA